MPIPAGSIYIGSDHTVQFDKVRDIDKNYLNSGSATFALTEKYTGTTVTTGTLDYVAASNGRYRGLIDRTVTVTLSENSFYYLTVVFVNSGFDTERRLELQAKFQGSS